MKNPFLIGQSIYLRPLERADAPRLVSYLNHPDITRTLFIHRPINLQAEEEYLAAISKSQEDIVLGIVVRSTDALIGATGLHRMDFKNRHVNFGIVIGEPEEWGKGYGTEATYLMVKYAFETLNMNRVWLHVYENNLRGLRAYEKVGFQKEGLLRQETYREGRYLNTLTMAILRAEWDERKSRLTSDDSPRRE